MDSSDEDIDLDDSYSESSDEVTSGDESWSSDNESTPVRTPRRPDLDSAGIDPASASGGDVSVIDKSYDNEDLGPSDALPPFRPARTPGIHLPDTVTRLDHRRFLTPGSFFKLFICLDMVERICIYTNDYAELKQADKPTLYKAWVALDPDELYRFLGLLMYMSIVQAPSIELYWSTKQLFHGLWARAFMSKLRYKQIQSFIKISNFTTENREDKLTKVRFMHDFLKMKCMKFWQPNQWISVDERMVPNKGRYCFRQYIKNKPTKWGMKLWVLADSVTGYTYNYEVYTGKTGVRTEHGLGYQVVMDLCKSLYNQGYKLFVDNFYTSIQLFADLLQKKLLACGTMLLNRKNIPVRFKDAKTFNKHSARGDMRWTRMNNMGLVQWKDNKIVNILTTMHVNLNERASCFRRTKVNNTFRKVNVCQPKSIQDYNRFMGGVDRSDQMIGKYKVLRKTSKYWKTLMYHFIDIARVNAYVMFKEYIHLHNDVPELQRPKRYSQLDFTIELIRELGGLDKAFDVPLFHKKKCNGLNDHTVVPIMCVLSRNCVRCYRFDHQERRSRFKCRTCDKHLCFNQKRNCLLDEHPLSCA